MVEFNLKIKQEQQHFSQQIRMLMYGNINEWTISGTKLPLRLIAKLMKQLGIRQSNVLINQSFNKTRQWKKACKNVHHNLQQQDKTCILGNEVAFEYSSDPITLKEQTYLSLKERSRIAS